MDILIRKSKTEDIVKILKLDDDKLTKIFPCDVSGWVQFLIQNVDNPSFFMMSVLDNDNLVGYIVAVNAIVPPINKNIAVLYSKTAGIESNKKVLEELIKWGREKRADSIEFVTDNPIGHAVYGFKKKATLMTMEL